MINEEIQAFSRLVAQFGMGQKILQLSQSEAALSDDWNSGNVHAFQKSIPAHRGKKTANGFVINVETKKPVRQSVIKDRMFGVTSFPKKNILINQVIKDFPLTEDIDGIDR